MQIVLALAASLALGISPAMAQGDPVAVTEGREPFKKSMLTTGLEFPQEVTWDQTKTVLLANAPVFGAPFTIFAGNRVSDTNRAPHALY